MLERVRTALRVNGSAFDGEIEGLIAAAMADLQVATGTSPDDSDPLVVQAVICYAKSMWGYDDPAIADRFAASYASIKAQLSVTAQEVIAHAD